MVNYLVFLAIYTAIFALFGLGLNLQWGFTGLINFGHVAFMTVGAYTTVLLSSRGVPIIVAMAIGVALAALLGLAIGLSTLRLRGDFLSIVTLGVAELIRLVVQNEEWLTRGTFGVQARSSAGAEGYPLPLDFLALDSNIVLMVLSLLMLALVFWLLERLMRSPWGRVLKAIREDEQVPKALGKNVFWYKLQALMLGGAIAGVAGAFYAWYLKAVYPNNFEPLMTFYAWIIVILGGAGNNAGTVLGAVIFSAYESGTRFAVPAILRSVLPKDLGNIDATVGAFRLVAIGLILMVLMIWRPQGILGKKEELTLGR